MTTRRAFLACALTTTPLLQSCSGGESAYRAAVRDTWRHGTGDAAQARELVRYATLAPSSHNTQCWRFEAVDGRISIRPDRSRRCPVVDPDDHHLYVSLGCAAENLVQAAAAAGLHADVAYDAGADRVDVRLTPTRPVASALFEAIPYRQCTRGPYDGKPVASNDLKRLEAVGRGDGVRVVLQTGRPDMERILDYVTRGNSVQMADRAFTGELKRWIRFDAADAVATGDGLFSVASGNPSIPRVLGPIAMSLFFTEDGENDRYAAQVRSSSGIAVFVSDVDDKPHWIEAGRCYERFALLATALGIRNAMLNQPVEVRALRPQFAALLGLSGRPDLVVRFGYGAAMPRSLRRPVDAVMG